MQHLAQHGVPCFFLLVSLAAPVFGDSPASSPSHPDSRCTWTSSAARSSCSRIATGPSISPRSSAATQPGFFASTPSLANVGFTKSAWWARLTLKNPANAVARGVPAPELSTHRFLDLFEPDGAGGWRHTATGDRQPFGTRPVAHRDFLFPLTLPASSQSTYLPAVRLAGTHRHHPVGAGSRRTDRRRQPGTDGLRHLLWLRIHAAGVEWAGVRGGARRRVPRVFLVRGHFRPVHAGEHRPGLSVPVAGEPAVGKRLPAGTAQCFVDHRAAIFHHDPARQGLHAAAGESGAGAAVAGAGRHGAESGAALLGAGEAGHLPDPDFRGLHDSLRHREPAGGVASREAVRDRLDGIPVRARSSSCSRTLACCRTPS